MNKRISISVVVILVILVFAAIFIFKKHCPTKTFSQGSEWEIAWNDEFNSDKIDLSKWQILEGTVKNTVNELQYYTSDDVYLQDGYLIIKSQKREYNNKQYTSGRVNGLPKFSQTHGKFEIRAKLPTGKGIHSAFWLIGKDRWPPEIDVFEMLGRKPETIYMTNHWTRFNLPFHIPGLLALTRTYNQGKFEGPDYSQDFHIFTIEWTPAKITWFIDGIERFSSNKGVPCEPMYPILNTQVGDDWAGKTDDSIFPQYYVIDYIRVYKK